MKNAHGFTLIELMITVAILAILLGIGVPAFRDVISRNRVTTITNDIVGTMQLARSEATKRRADVTVCRRNAAGTACADAADWSVGWLLTTSDGPLRVWDAPQGPPVITGPNAGVTFSASGLADAVNCVSITFGGHERHIAIGNTGRVASGTGAACP